MVCRQHQKYLVVSNAIFLEILVHDHHVESVPIVEVELGCRQQNVDVVTILKRAFKVDHIIGLY